MADRQVSEGDGGPFEGKHNNEAWRAGQRAYRDGKERTAYPRYARRSLADAWQAGWDAEREASTRLDARGEEDPAAAPFDTATRVVSDGPSRVRNDLKGARKKERSASPHINPRTFWPKGQAMPTRYERKPYYPCRNCTRVLDEKGGQAVALLCTANGKAYMKCRCCGHAFQMDLAP